ncbi:class I SAM-dependent methyltransferase [Saccharospirillum salsuginis]|uniref:Methyltransferase type 11 domain-containing protein n=1 Tax=Saccharospirillum salsuginis TaxID=418750 RepID=A0A918KU13_9GAMM|nr:class I SAM-dependent methyltransferase [Saccharospirillum salsuginis]GGX74292.1 hypothetical protein GCM10007392_47080 [Saccharospirillum salsuginis]
MKSDGDWLNRWLPELENKIVLELGCGEGMDTAILADYSAILIACDLNPRFKGIVHPNTVVVDHSKPLPFKTAQFDVVVASLCLHYFNWQVTEGAVNEISRVLKRSGLLICRLNSTNDVNYGAYGYPEIDTHFYNVNGVPKRFFDLSDITRLFSDNWQIMDLKEQSIDRYDKEKLVWEVGAVLCSSAIDRNWGG